MMTLPDAPRSVYSDADAEAFADWISSLDADNAWWAETQAAEEAAGDDDRGWFAALAADHRRYTGALDPCGLHALAADCLEDLALHMVRLDCRTADAYLGHSMARFTAAQAAALTEPTAWQFGSSLAEGLDSLASWHVSEGSTADRLVALLMIDRAKAAEARGVHCYEDLLAAEAAELSADGDDDHEWN